MGASNAGNAPPFHSASLYVGDLAFDASEGLLFEIFNTVGPVASIRVCRDAVTKRSLGYAYVNFHHVPDAERALDTMNYTLIKGKPCRIMWSQRDPTLRKSGVGNVFVKNLDATIDHKALYDTFSLFGNILSCKVATDEHGRSQGYGYVHYETEESAEEAISKLNKMTIQDKEVYVGHFVRRTDRSGQSDWTNLYVKNFPSEWTDVELESVFAAFGKITSCKVQPGALKREESKAEEAKENARKAAENRTVESAKAEAAKEQAINDGDETAVAAAEEVLSRIAGEEAEAAEDQAKAEGSAFGWVNFEDHEAAQAAVDALNGATSLTVDFEENDGTLKEASEKTEEGPENPEESTSGKADDKDDDDATVATANGVDKENKKPSSEAAGKEGGGKRRVIELKQALFVGRAQKKVDRERELKAKFEAAKLERIKKYQGVNLFVKNLDDSITDDDLREHFQPYGNITSARVMKDNGTQASRGFGFVCFSTPEEAAKAVADMNNVLVRGKPIFVALAQRKEVRRAQLEAQHNQRRAVSGPYALAGPGGAGPGGAMGPHVAAAPHLAPYGAVPVMYQPGAQHPMMPPQLQGGPHSQQMPVNARGGYVIARGSPRGPLAGNAGDLRGFAGGVPRGYAMAPHPHSMTPAQLAAMQAAGQQPPNGVPPNGAAPNNRRRSNRNSQQGQNQNNGGPQQYKYTQNARNAQNMGQQAMGGAASQQMHASHAAAIQQQQMMQAAAAASHGVGPGNMQGLMANPMASQMGGQNPQQQQQQQREAQQHAAQQRAVAAAQEPLTLSALANASPQVQKNMIGERLYPLIHHSQPDLAGKITGMLLEMDNSELLHLLESPDALRMKVSEALEVLKQHQAQLQAQVDGN